MVFLAKWDTRRRDVTVELGHARQDSMAIQTRHLKIERGSDEAIRGKLLLGKIIVRRVGQRSGRRGEKKKRTAACLLPLFEARRRPAREGNAYRRSRGGEKAKASRRHPKDIRIYRALRQGKEAMNLEKK